MDLVVYIGSQTSYKSLHAMEFWGPILSCVNYD